MIKKFEIWDSRINMDDWKDFIEEKREEYPGKYDDDYIINAHWYCDGYNICCDAYHHDGTNHYIYREIRDINNIDNLLNKIYYGKNFKNALNRCTKSIAKHVGSVYGLCKGE